MQAYSVLHISVSGWSLTTTTAQPLSRRAPLSKRNEDTPFHIFALDRRVATTLSPKWLAKPLSAALVEPFLRSLNQQPEQKHYKLSLEDVVRVVVGGREADMTLPASTFVAGGGEGVMVHLEMRPLPEPKPAARSTPSSATFQVTAGGHRKETKLSSKWLSKPLSTALIEPFLDAVNAEPEQTQTLTLADVARVVVDGEGVLDITQPAKSFVQPGRGAVQVEIEIQGGATRMPPPSEANPLLDILQRISP